MHVIHGKNQIQIQYCSMSMSRWWYHQEGRVLSPWPDTTFGEVSSNERLGYLHFFKRVLLHFLACFS